MDRMLKQLFIDLEALLKEYEFKFKKIQDAIEKADAGRGEYVQSGGQDIALSEILDSIRKLKEPQMLDLSEFLITRLQINFIEKGSPGLGQDTGFSRILDDVRNLKELQMLDLLEFLIALLQNNFIEKKFPRRRQ